MLFLGIFQAPFGLYWIDDSINSVFGHLERDPLDLLASAFPGPFILILLIVSIKLPRDGAAVAHVLAVAEHLLTKGPAWLTIVLFHRLGGEVITSPAALLIEGGKCALLV